MYLSSIFVSPKSFMTISNHPKPCAEHPLAVGRDHRAHRHVKTTQGDFQSADRPTGQSAHFISYLCNFGSYCAFYCPALTTRLKTNESYVRRRGFSLTRPQLLQNYSQTTESPVSALTEIRKAAVTSW